MGGVPQGQALRSGRKKRAARPTPAVLGARRDLDAKPLENGEPRVSEYSCRQHDNPPNEITG
jgi:hypothetical protein